MADTETRLLLVRHGQSVAQEQGFLSGHDTCQGLSDLGRNQAAALRDRLVASGEAGQTDVVFTSILSRAIETADIIRPALGGHEARQECDWCEIHAGEAEGLTYEEMQIRFPAVGDPFDPYRRRLPGGETWAEFYVRAGARLRRIADEHVGERVVVVCHGGIIGASFVALGDLPIPSASVMTHEALNTSLTEWRWTGSQWRLVRFNDAAHLSSPVARPV